MVNRPGFDRPSPGVCGAVLLLLLAFGCRGRSGAGGGADAAPAATASAAGGPRASGGDGPAAVEAPDAAASATGPNPDAEPAAEDLGVPKDAESDSLQGEWCDPAARLCWQNPPESAETDWETAVAYCRHLSWAGSPPGTWRLPSIGELRTLVRGCPELEAGGACRVDDDCLGDECWGPCGCSAPGGRPNGPGGDGYYWPSGLREPPGVYAGCAWSSSSAGEANGEAYSILFSNGLLGRYEKSKTLVPRCVRDAVPAGDSPSVAEPGEG